MISQFQLQFQLLRKARHATTEGLCAVAVTVVFACLLITSCASVPPAVGPANPPVTKTVSDPIAGIAQIGLDDAQQAVSDLKAAGANLSTAPMSLQDSYTCAVWIHNTAIPQAQQIVAGLAPGGIHPKGAYSLFIEGKIAYIKGKGAISSAQSTFIDTFNHYCGAALAGDVNAINQLLLKVGIGVLPGGGVATGILSGILPSLP